jgi:hypothetical protein
MPPAKKKTAPDTYEISGAEKKQIPLRLSCRLYAEIAKWAEDDFRSVNGQIEYLLNEAVKKRANKDR